MFGKAIASLLALSVLACTPTQEIAHPLWLISGAGEAGFSEACEPWDDWDKPAEPFRIHGNTFYVGTCGITALLIVGEKQHFLLDTGTEAGSQTVLGNIRKLGVEPLEIFAVGYSHEHFDHVGGMAKIVEATGATLVSHPRAQAVFETGEDNPADPQFGMHDPMTPVPVGMLVENGETIVVGGTTFRAISTPGHTPGGLSWQWESCDFRGENCKTIVYADSLSPVSRDDYKFSDHPDYLAEYRAGLARLAALDCDILLTPHPSASEMLKRAATGTFEGGLSCKEYSSRVSQRLDARLSKEAKIE